MMLLQAGQLGLYRRGSIWTDELPPDMVPGATLWLDGTDTATIWSEAPPGGTNVTTDGADIPCAQNKVDLTGFFVPGSNYPKLTTPAVNGASAFKFTAYGSMRAGGSAPISTYVTSSAKLILAVVRLNSAPSDSGNVYTNPIVFGDENGYVGLHYYDAGSGNARVQAYNYASSVATAEASTPFGQWVVLTMSHQSSQLRLRIDGGAWISVASGATSDVSSIAGVGSSAYHAGVSREFDLAHLVTFNTAQTDAAISAVEHWLATDCAITPWW